MKFYLIELFSGTGSFGKSAGRVAHSMGYDVVKLSLDIHPKYNPTECTDIMKWDYKSRIHEFLKNAKESDIVWVHASPPCNEYSRAKTSHPRDLPKADAIVKRTLQIIKFAHPNFWTIENPQGMLQDRPFMQRLSKYKHVASYCKFGRPFRKNTNIWTNVPSLKLPVCKNGSYCAAKEKLGHHPSRAQDRDSHVGSKTIQRNSVDKLYAIPSRLSSYIVRTALNN
jgi:site-specific DNA-cytosine methylase